MCEFAFVRYGMFWIYVERIWVSEFCQKSAQNTPFIKILHSVTHKCPVFENFLPLCDPLKPPPCLPPLLPIYPIPLSLSWLYIYFELYTTFSFMSYHKPRIPNIQVSNSKSQQTKNRHLTIRNDPDII